MNFIIKLFPEITIKSQSVRLRFIKILVSNILNILKVLDREVSVIRNWDNIVVYVKDNVDNDEIYNALTRIPGIHQILLIEEYKFSDLNHIFKLTYFCYAKFLINKSFCVRVKRQGKHNFSSAEVERYIGGELHKYIPSARVKLNCPDITINLEIKNDKVILVKACRQGIGGFPIGTQEDVLSLISGGFDSMLASYMLMRRGCRVHYCFFNLGGTNHEIMVKQSAYNLWYRFGSSHKVRFIIIDFRAIINEILKKIDHSYMGVIFKRIMIRTASIIAERFGIQALVTGEVLGQVASQTLSNLCLIDNVTNTLILRPLVSYDKEHIIKLIREIGMSEFVNTIPEFCSIVSKKPTVKAVKSHIELEEKNFNFTLINDVISAAQVIDIKHIMNHSQDDHSIVEVVNTFSVNDIILDIRTPDEQKTKPLKLLGVNIKLLPFYKLNSQLNELSPDKTYLLYCDRGIMSHLQALYLYEYGFKNIKVYKP